MGFRGVGFFILLTITKSESKDQSQSFLDTERKLLKSVNYFRNTEVSIRLRKGLLGGVLLLLFCFVSCLGFFNVWKSQRTGNNLCSWARLLPWLRTLPSAPKRKHLDF